MSMLKSHCSFIYRTWGFLIAPSRPKYTYMYTKTIKKITILLSSFVLKSIFAAELTQNLWKGKNTSLHNCHPHKSNETLIGLKYKNAKLPDYIILIFLYTATRTRKGVAYSSSNVNGPSPLPDTPFLSVADFRRIDFEKSLPKCWR